MGRADAVSIEPAVAIVTAAKPIAILRITVLIPFSEHPQPLGIKPDASHRVAAVRHSRAE